MSGAGIYIKTDSGLVAAATVPGKQGSQGPQSSLTKGTATTGAAGTSMDFSITGAGPVQTLNLTIPRGNPGSPTEFELRGTGSPEGVVNAPVGTYYTDTAITNGAMRWAKMSGTGNTGWKCPDYDSGLRRMDFADFAAPFNVTGSQAYLRRLGDAVYYSALLYTTSTLAAGNYPWTGAPYLWGLGTNMYGVTGASPLWNSNTGAYLGTLTSSSVVVPATIPAGTPMRGQGVAVWAAPIPTSLPGTAA